MERDVLYDFARRLDRSLFIDNDYKEDARLDQPLPIGFGQTISQPSLVVEMTRVLSPDRNTNVLEIGTGSGYQTAILAAFSKHVYTVERIPELSEKAKNRLDSLGYSNITYRIGDGSEGWPDRAPFDRIIGTAAASRIPDEWIEQLSCGGILVMPVGQRAVQVLVQITKNATGEVLRKEIENVRFVELKGKYGWTSEN